MEDRFFEVCIESLKVVYIPVLHIRDILYTPDPQSACRMAGSDADQMSALPPEPFLVEGNSGPVPKFDHQTGYEVLTPGFGPVPEPSSSLKLSLHLNTSLPVLETVLKQDTIHGINNCLSFSRSLSRSLPPSLSLSLKQKLALHAGADPSPNRLLLL